MKNKSYIGISLVVLVFGIIFIPRIIDRIKSDQVNVGDRLNIIDSNQKSDLLTIGKAPDFSLTNQDNKTITNKDYLGSVYVLEFFFTTCPTICPKMNINLGNLAKTFYDQKKFGIASITINPEHDTAEVLKNYAENLNYKKENWHFLTGERDYIYKIANKGFNIYAAQNDDALGGFEHSGFFALIDKKGNIRCRKDNHGNPILYYDGIEKEGLNQITEDIKLLLKE